LLCGSMNFTSNALGAKGKSSNFETGILYGANCNKFFEELGLSEMISDKNSIDLSNVKFEKPQDQETPRDKDLIIQWVDTNYETLDIYLREQLNDDIKNIIIKFYGKSDTAVNEFKAKQYSFNLIKLAILDVPKGLLMHSMCIQLEISFQDKSKLLSHKAIINKIPELNEAIAKSEVTKAIKILSTIVPTNEDYGIMLDLLRCCLFESYNHDLIKSKIHETKTKLTTVKKEDQVDYTGKLSIADVVSTHPTKERTNSLGYFDYSGNAIKDIFINTFLKKEKKAVFSEDKINKEFELDKNFDNKIKKVEEEELEDIPETQTSLEEEQPVDIKPHYKKDSNLEHKLLKRLVKRYIDHIMLLERNPNFVNIENEFVRHFAVFWMVTKGLKENYSIISQNKKFSLKEFLWFNMFFATILLNRNLGAIFTKHIEERKYLYEEGITFGMCSLMTGFYLTDMQLCKKISQRFMVYDKRKDDLTWLMNKILILSLVSRFSDKDFDGVLEQIKTTYNNFKGHAGKTLNNITFEHISEYATNAREVARLLGIRSDMWHVNIKNTVSDVKRGDLIFIYNKGLYLVKNGTRENIELYGGVDLDGRFYYLNLALKETNFVKLCVNNVVDKYFGELLNSSYSYWYAGTLEDSIY
jgi:hypothetical protein